MTVSRYTDLESHADCGLGADENGVRRFTRLFERAEQAARSEKNDPAPAATGCGIDVHPITKKRN